MPTNELVSFARGPDADILDRAELVDWIDRGNPAGLALPKLLNRIVGQPTVIGEALGDMIVEDLGVDVLDNGDVAGFAALLAQMIAFEVDALDLTIGSIYAFGFEDMPLGFLKPEGQAVSRTVYHKLFDKIGVTYGPGDGVNTFNLPDLRGRSVFGADQGAGRLSLGPVGSVGGSDLVGLDETQIAPHVHVYSVPDNHHTHRVGRLLGHAIDGGLYAFAPAGCCDFSEINPDWYGNVWNGGHAPGSYSQNVLADPHTSGMTIESQGAGTPHENMQPTMVVAFGIKAL